VTHLAAAVRWEIALTLFVIFAAVSYQALVGRIETAGLLVNKQTGAFDSGRLQSLLSTLFVAALTLLRLKEMKASGTVALPSSELLLAVGGSQALYLALKFLQTRGTGGAPMAEASSTPGSDAPARRT